MTMPLALAVARRALVIAIVALLVAIVAVVVAFLDGAGSDPAESTAPEQAPADAAAARAEAEEAAAIAGASVARAEEAAAMAQQAAVMAGASAARAEEAAAMAYEAAVTADASAAQAAAAAQAEADGAATTGEASATGTAAEDTDTTGDEPEAASVDGADDAPGDGPEQAPVDATVPLPGDPYEFGPSAGAGLAVVGVSFDSGLNVRDVPNGEIIARLDNVMDGVRDPVLLVREANSDGIVARLDLNQGVVATGNTRKLPTTIWHELRVGDIVGWATSAYLAPLGSSRDATAEVVEALGGTPTADTLRDLGLQVSEVFASSGEVQSRIAVSSQPGVFEAVGDITLDVLGLPDDSVRGYRINVTADAGADDWTQDDPGPFTLRSVSATPICDSHRGVSEEGLCN